MNHPNATDYLKYCAAEAKAHLDYVRDRLGQSDPQHPLHEDEIETMQDFLAEVQQTVIEAAAVFCRDGKDFDTYSDGRPVRTQLETEPGVVFEYRWHPQPDHPDNHPHNIYTAERGRDRRRRTVFVTAPGVLDSITVGPALTVVR